MRRSLVFALRARNVDVLTAAEANMINREDDDHLAVASELGRTLFTHNTADYCVLHQHWVQRKRTHSGIIVAPQQRYSVGEEMRRIMSLISRRTAEEVLCRIDHIRLGLAIENLRGAIFAAATAASACSYHSKRRSQVLERVWPRCRSWAASHPVAAGTSAR